MDIAILGLLLVFAIVACVDIWTKVIVKVVDTFF